MSDDYAVCEHHPLDEDKIAKAKENLPDLDYVTSIFKLMGDETRASILFLLSQDRWCVHELASCLETSVSNISHHLRLLKTARLVKCQRDGQRVYYSLDDEHVVALLKEAFEHASHS